MGYAMPQLVDVISDVNEMIVLRTLYAVYYSIFIRQVLIWKQLKAAEGLMRFLNHSNHVDSTV